MSLKAIHNDVEFGVGDTIRVHQNIVEGDKKRIQVFEGMVIAIRGKGISKSLVVRRIGPAQIGIEKIFPLAAPIIDKIEVSKEGVTGVRRAKLYFTRTLPKREVEKIYQRKTRKERASQAASKKKPARAKAAKKA